MSADALQLTRGEELALELLLESMARAVRERLPQSLELISVGIEFGRPEFASQATRPEEMH